MPSGIMPNVVGKTLETAKQEIEAAANDPVIINVEQTPGTPVDTVKEQDPEPGQQVPNEVTIVVFN